MFLKSQSYDFDVIAHAGAPLGVDWLCKSFKNCMDVFEKFEIFIERSGEKSTIENFFPTPKNHD